MMTTVSADVNLRIGRRCLLRGVKRGVPEDFIWRALG
jgi:hypothetical protein